jgi:hypothetical protein
MELNPKVIEVVTVETNEKKQSQLQHRASNRSKVVQNPSCDQLRTTKEVPSEERSDRSRICDSMNEV